MKAFSGHVAGERVSGDQYEAGLAPTSFTAKVARESLVMGVLLARTSRLRNFLVYSPESDDRERWKCFSKPVRVEARPNFGKLGWYVSTRGTRFEFRRLLRE